MTNENKWYSFFWVFGILVFGSSISDMIKAEELNYKLLVFVIIALAAWLHGLYRTYKQETKVKQTNI
ncbi:hypothetical protein F4V57_11595 [Acinetobacter qingfengensis]|nr:hypothetical protein [Acinetobacter qingfengensis]KAA8731882.1 hypothetical protein F4V57_11595 [Acinetobacter qingfengensis]